MKIILNSHIDGTVTVAFQEDYSKWSIEKFCRLTERYRESAWCAGTHDAYLVCKAKLDHIEEAFKRLHPRAYRNFLQRLYEANH